MTTSKTRAATLCALLATTCLATPAFAQATGTGTPFKNIDDNGVDLTDGRYNLSVTSGSIGAGEAELSLTDHFGGSSGHNLQLYFRRYEQGGQANVVITFGDTSETFTGALGATSFTPAKGNGATLTKLSTQHYRHVSADGTTVDFTWPSNLSYQGGSTGFCSATNQLSCDLLAQSVVSPSGRNLYYNWRAGENCTTSFPPPGEPVTDCAQFYRLTSVSNSFGYSVSFSYQNNTDPSSGLPPASWRTLSGASFANSVAGTAPAPMSYAYPSSTVTEITDTAGRLWRITRDSSQYITGVKRPGSSVNDITIAQGANGVSQVVKDGVTTNYSRAVIGSTATMTVTNALSQQTVVTSDLTKGRPTSVRDPLNRTTTYAYDASSRLTQVTAPEGNAINHTLDARGNVIQTTAIAKAGSGLANIVTSATFATCTSGPSCNKPLTTTDAAGYVTEYVYDAVTGLPTSVTLPAANGLQTTVRPQTRYGYTATNPATGFQPVQLLTSISACQTLASCAGAADEVKTTVAYNANLLPSGVSSGNGAGTLTAISTMTYDATGNLLTVDGPLTGTADTIRYRYDAARQTIGAIGPDPDGTGTLKHRAQRIGYNADGQVTSVENGTVNSQSDADWALFASLESVTSTYDANSRKTADALNGGGSVHALTQYGYDGLGRPECVATRMNPAAFGSLPAACTLGTISTTFGPDRIVKTIYDVAGQVTKVQTALGTADQSDEVTSTYRLNGGVETVTDAEGNRTTYEYDGHDRLAKTRFPSPTTDGVSSTTDYELLGYDNRSKLLSRRIRDGRTITYSYDALSRPTGMNLPGSEPDASYAHDLLGRLISTTSTDGYAASFDYDALGRKTRESSTWATKYMQYDLTGRRTRLTHSDGFFVTHEHLVTGEVSYIRENGTVLLGAFTYDDLGRRTNLTRGNGTVSVYAYDPASRLSQLIDDLPGSVSDRNDIFAYNPASQIVSRTGSNDAYAWTGHANQNVADTVNGLNQIVTTGSTGVTHDARGNITGAGLASYAYDSLNRMTSGGGATLTYEPLGRLAYIAPAGMRFEYDGTALIAELSDANQFVRRFVHGPGVDEPLVWYEGSDTTDKRWLHADERGSIVAVTAANGNALAINSYDDYGKGAPTNYGRFQYTGQTWLPELGPHAAVYYYKARMYDPRLGRFVQTDPIGYGDGMNMYAYVGGDPVNRIDPTGMVNICFSSFGPGRTFEDAGGESVVEVGPRTNSCVELPDWNATFGRDLPASNYVPGLAPSVTLPQRTQVPTPCQRAFLKDQLGSRGLPTSQINNLKFVSGLDSNANALTRQAFNGGAGAVTQGSTVYVQPGGFNTVANFRSPTGFEEAYHTAQFASNSGFYSTYGLLSLGGLLSMGDSYNGNAYEAFAKGAAKQMFEASKSGMCPK